MKRLILALCIVTFFAGPLCAQGGMLALFSEGEPMHNYADSPVGSTYNVRLFYVRGDGPYIGRGCEFKLVLSTSGAEFLAPAWSPAVVVTLGNVANGISLVGDGCLSSDMYGSTSDTVYIGTIPVRNNGEEAGFSVSVVGDPDAFPPTALPIITACSNGNPINEVQGGQFFFNATLVVAEAVAEFPNEVRARFSEMVTPQTAENVLNYSVFETANPLNTLPVTAASLLADQTTVVLALGGLLSNSLGYSLRATNVEDLNGHTVFSSHPTPIRQSDWTPPALNAVNIVSGAVLELVFSEPMEPATGSGVSNYAVFETFNPLSVVPVVGAELRQDGVGVRLSLAHNLAAGVDFTVQAHDVMDAAGNVIGESSQKSFIMPDIYPPAITDLRVIDRTLLEVVFNEPLDPAAVAGATYSLIEKVHPANSLPVIARNLVNGNRVRLSLGAPIQFGIEYVLVIREIRDLAGNPMVPATRDNILVPLAISHAPVTCGTLGRDVYILWEATDPRYSIASTCLRYRRHGSVAWVEQCESNVINPVVMTVPGGDMGEAGVDYYIVATNGIGISAFQGTPEVPYFVPPCAPMTCQRPLLALAGYQTVSYSSPLWRVQVQAVNVGPGAAKNVDMTMESDLPWLTLPDPCCSYENLSEGQGSVGGVDGFTLDLSSYPGGSFNVWFDVTYQDTCGNAYHVRLDPEFVIDGEPSPPNAIAVNRLAQNHPNPFNPTTTVGYQLAARTRVILQIYDVSGRLVRTLVDDYRGPGSCAATWDGKDDKDRVVASGIYFYSLQGGTYRETKRMVLLR